MSNSLSRLCDFKWQQICVFVCDYLWWIDDGLCWFMMIWWWWWWWCDYDLMMFCYNLVMIYDLCIYFDLLWFDDDDDDDDDLLWSVMIWSDLMMIWWWFMMSWWWWFDDDLWWFTMTWWWRMMILIYNNLIMGFGDLWVADDLVIIYDDLLTRSSYFS